MILNQKLQSDIIQWDVKTWSKSLDYWENNIDWNAIHNCLELGGREGGLSLWLALKGKTVICSDLKDTKITAEKLHILHNVSPLISYQDIDATNIPYENFFDLIVFKSIIGGIGRNNNIEIQKKVFDEIYKALKPNGKLLFVENLIASPFHQYARKKFVDWGSSWRYISVEELNIFLEQFSSYKIKTTGFLSAFGRNERQRHFLATIDNLFFNKLTFDKWKYVSYVIAQK
ncbi:MAG: class I SAM-dependent methyltransferase [Fusobacteriaceae bacterium]|jgi:SAM-dependent methyltransferase|nr:class I SAM-dependent methyltransferase [Fusobacteriaceae bacterium]